MQVFFFFLFQTTTVHVLSWLRRLISAAWVPHPVTPGARAQTCPAQDSTSADTVAVCTGGGKERGKKNLCICTLETVTASFECKTKDKRAFSNGEKSLY